MPTPIATVSKATIRADMAGADRLPGTATGNGASGGTTVVDSGYASLQPDFFRGKYLLITSGTCSGQWRLITDFTSSSGTYTVAPAFSAQIASAVTYEVYSLRPDLFTLAVNRAIQRLYPKVYRPELDYLVVELGGNGVSRSYGLPHGMRDAKRITQSPGGALALIDRFDRADSSTSIGGSWTADASTWGVSSERGYSVSDADGDRVSFDAGMPDGVVQATVRGTLNSGSTYRSPALIFRALETYADAFDASNYLVVRLLNATVDLRRVLGGSEASITTGALTTSDGVDYLLRVVFEGVRVRVYVDGTCYIDHELLGPNLRYLEGQRAGVRWDKGGSPSTAARFDDYRAYRIAGTWMAHHDWRQSADGRVLEFGRLGQRAGLGVDRLLRVEGTEALTALASDTTYGTLATDSTATLEIATTDPAYLLLVEGARAELYQYAQDPNWNQNLDSIPAFAQMEQAQRQMVERMRGMALPAKGMQFAY